GCAGRQTNAECGGKALDLCDRYVVRLDIQIETGRRAVHVNCASYKKWRWPEAHRRAVDGDCALGQLCSQVIIERDRIADHSAIETRIFEFQLAGGVKCAGLARDLAFGRYITRCFRGDFCLEKLLKPVDANFIHIERSAKGRTQRIILRNRSSVTLDMQRLSGFSPELYRQIERKWLSGGEMEKRQIDVIVDSTALPLL